MIKGLNFIETVRLINYLRSETRAGRIQSTVSSKEVFDDDMYLKPILDDDPVLYNLDDLDQEIAQDDSKNPLEEVDSLRQQLDQLQAQFAEYREQVQHSLLAQADDTGLENRGNQASGSKIKKMNPDKHEAQEYDYFDSYSYNCKCFHQTL